MAFAGSRHTVQQDVLSSGFPHSSVFRCLFGHQRNFNQLPYINGCVCRQLIKFIIERREMIFSFCLIRRLDAEAIVIQLLSMLQQHEIIPCMKQFPECDKFLVIDLRQRQLDLVGLLFPAAPHDAGPDAAASLFIKGYSRLLIRRQIQKVRPVNIKRNLCNEIFLQLLVPALIITRKIAVRHEIRKHVHLLPRYGYVGLVGRPSLIQCIGCLQPFYDDSIIFSLGASRKNRPDYFQSFSKIHLTSPPFM